MTHQMFRVRAPLKTSMRLGKFPVSLDGMLWHCLFLRTGDADIARDRLAAVLSEKEGVYQASALRFGVHGSSTLIATQTATMGVMRPETDLAPEHFHPNGRGNKYARLQVEGGPYKNRLTKHDTYYAPEVTWDAVGDPQAACELLNFYVFAVGLEANRGFGSVGRFWWEPLEEDTTWIDEDHSPARALPVPIWESIATSKADPPDQVRAQTTPPYRKGEQTLCVMPPRVRRLRLQEPV